MNDRARQEFVGGRLLTLKNVLVTVPPMQTVAVTLQIETTVWSRPTLLVTRPGREPVRVPLASLYAKDARGLTDLTEKQYRVIRALRHCFAAEILARQEAFAAAVPLTPEHLLWFDTTEGYLTIPSQVGRVFLYRSARKLGARLVLTEAPPGHPLQTALCANNGAPVKIWLVPTMHLYHTEVSADRDCRPETILRNFLRTQFPQPLDLVLV